MREAGSLKPFVCTFCVCRRVVERRERESNRIRRRSCTHTHPPTLLSVGAREEEEERGPKESQGEELRSQPVGCTPEFF
jgi:hypothetical protein